MTTAVRACVALGSNLGDRAEALEGARRGLARLPGTRVVACSSIEETEPLGGLDQPRYLNQMVLLETTLSPHDLLEALLEIERRAGRVRDGSRWAPRLLDCDLVLHGSAELSDRRLTVPHPGLRDRTFWHHELEELGVMNPLADTDAPTRGRVTAGRVPPRGRIGRG